MNVIKSINGVTTIAPNSIVNADCLDAMKLIPDKSIDCIIADLPFGITACKWDVVIPFDRLWDQYKRIIKPNGAIVLFGSQPFTSALVMSNPKWFKYEWIWEKSKGSNFASVKYQPFKAHENILIFGAGRVNYYPIRERCADSSLKKDKLGAKRFRSQNSTDRITGIKKTGQNFVQDGKRYPYSYQRFSKEGRYDKDINHPTRKPVALIEYLIKTYTQEGELILDNTAGSGTLAIAAINTNRQYICIEKDEHYFEVMRNRIANHDPFAPIKTKKAPRVPKGQLTLFGDDVCA